MNSGTPDEIVKLAKELLTDSHLECERCYHFQGTDYPKIWCEGYTFDGWEIFFEEKPKKCDFFREFEGVRSHSCRGVGGGY